MSSGSGGLPGTRRWRRMRGPSRSTAASPLRCWRLGRVLAWKRAGGDSLAVALSLRAGALNRGLAPRDSLLVAIDSLRESDVPSTWAEYQRLSKLANEAVRRYPDDSDVWLTRGEVRVHLGIYRGVTMEETLADFERAIALDSAYAPAYIHAIELAARVRGFQAARDHAREYIRRAPGDVTAAGIQLALDLSRTTPGHDPTEIDRLARVPANVLFHAWLPFYGAVDSSEVAVRVARALAASPDTSAPWLSAGFRSGMLVFSLLHRGHLHEAAAAVRPGMIYNSRFLAELSLFNRVPPAEAQVHFRAWLTSGNLEAAMSGLPTWAARGDTGSIVRLGSLGDSLGRSSPNPMRRELGTYTAAAAKAYLALARRDTAAALTRFAALPDSLCSECYLEPLALLLLRSAHGENGKAAETMWRRTDLPLASEVLANLVQARAAARVGQRARAIRGYRWVVDGWRSADPELQPYVVEAREGLQAIAP